jgi:hypothetical protein
MERFLKTGTIILPFVFIACAVGNTVMRFGCGNFLLVIISSLMTGFMLTLVAGVLLIPVWVVIGCIETAKSKKRRQPHDD